METVEATKRKLIVWVILGGQGQLGLSFRDVLTQLGMPHQILGKDTVDITDEINVKECFAELKPAVVVNCAAWTAVDNAEDFPTEAFSINADGARNVAIASRDIGARLVHISTDYVFRGDESGAHNEYAATSPTSVYGTSKLAGEEVVLSEYGHNSIVVRTAWLYSKYGTNFVKTMVCKALTSSAVRVVNDQHGQPTLTTDLAKHVVELVSNRRAIGIFHGTNSGSTTWYELTRAIYEALDVSTSLVSPVDSSAYPTKARRPTNSVLGHHRTISLGIPEMRSWSDALAESLPEISELLSKELS